MSVLKTLGLVVLLIVGAIGLLLSVGLNAALYGGWFKGFVITALVLITWELFTWSLRREPHE